MHKPTKRIILAILVISILLSFALPAAAARPTKSGTLASSLAPYRSEVPLSMQHQLYLYDVCKELEVPYSIMLGLIEVESGFQHDFENSVRYGYAGVPKNFVAMFPESGVTDIHNTFDNLRAATYLLQWLRARHNSWDETLVCYDIGERAASSWVFNYGEYTTSFSEAVVHASLRWAKVVG